MLRNREETKTGKLEAMHLYNKFCLVQKLPSSLFRFRFSFNHLFIHFYSIIPQNFKLVTHNYLSSRDLERDVAIN